MDDELDIQPWPVLELIGRAVALTTVANRGLLEMDEEADVFSRETDRFELCTWARTELANWITDTELAILNTPVGNMDEDQLLVADEALYGAGAIAWALRAVTANRLPVPDSEAFNDTVMAWAPHPWDQVRNLQKRARLHSDEDLAAERERAELWFWRGTPDLDASDLAEVVAEVGAVGLIPIVDGDFATDDGRSFHALSEDERDDLVWIASLRLRALNWVCGLGETWDTAPLMLD